MGTAMSRDERPTLRTTIEPSEALPIIERYLAHIRRNFDFTRPEVRGWIDHAEQRAAALRRP